MTKIKKINGKLQKDSSFEKDILDFMSFPDNKKSLSKEIKKLIPDITKDNPDMEKMKEFGNKALLLSRIFENDTHVGLMESFNEKYRMLVREMTPIIIKEYDCQNELEKSLAGVIVNAYVRIIDNSRRLNNELEGVDITHNRNTYIANLSKQLDRAHRQLISSIVTLKQLKSPHIEMNIKANTAFLSNNQQVNVNQNEIINPQ